MHTIYEHWGLMLSTGIGTFVFNNIVTVFVTSMPAPTKDSSSRYAYWFRVLNTIIGNLKRAQSTSIEGSPNWQDAVDKHIAANPPVVEQLGP